jgi:hypothetical protein
MNTLANTCILGVFLFLTPERFAGATARVARDVGRSFGRTEKEVGTMNTLTSGWKYIFTAAPTSVAGPRPIFGPTAS